MKISKCKKYVTWNIVSVVGYIGMMIAVIFFVMLALATAPLHMRADLDRYFYDYIINYLINPYYLFYKSQLIFILIMLILSIFENGYYKRHGKFGLRLFGNYEKQYSVMFSIGLMMNFLPLYMAFMLIVINLMKIF